MQTDQRGLQSQCDLRGSATLVLGLSRFSFLWPRNADSTARVARSPRRAGHFVQQPGCTHGRGGAASTKVSISTGLTRRTGPRRCPRTMAGLPHTGFAERLPHAGIEDAKAPLFQSVDRSGRLSGRSLTRARGAGDDQAPCGGGGSAGVDVLPHVPCDGHHGVSVERGYARARPTDCRLRVAADDEAVRPDGGHGHARRDRTHRDLTGSERARPGWHARGASRSAFAWRGCCHERKIGVLPAGRRVRRRARS